MKKFKEKIHISSIFMISGIIICCLPLVFDFITNRKQQSLISSYEYEIEEKTDIDLEAELEMAHKYNEILFKTNGILVGNNEYTQVMGNYENILNISGSGMMGVVQIPNINVDLPIYHGTDDKVLSNAVGHVEYSSFPVGGENIRALISAHRGSPTAKLFTRLDELKQGDLFFIKICGEKLAYEINDITVIKPEDMDKLDIVPNEDLVSLITCTPYGVNTHRLIVTGHRVPYVEQEENEIKPNMLSFRETLFILIPMIFVFLFIKKQFKKSNLERRS